MSQHWYSRDAKLISEVPVKSRPGHTRPPTLKDARVLDLFPSVSTILDILGKPSLTNWKIEQAIKTAVSNPIAGQEEAEYVKEIAEQSQNYTRYAADFGTAVHAVLENLWQDKHGYISHPQSRKIVTVATSAFQWMQDHGYVCEKSEFTFANTELGYAGTCDWLGRHYGLPVIVDFKTREGNTDFYLEQGLQLSGYAIGINEADRRRISLLIDRETGEVASKTWSLVETTKHDKHWRALWEYWCVANNWRQ